MRRRERRFHAALAGLSPDARAVFLASCADDLAYGEIAARRGVGVAAVRRLLADALVDLSDAMARYERGPVRRAVARTLLARSDARQRDCHRLWCAWWRLTHPRAWSLARPAPSAGVDALERFVAATLPAGQRVAYGLYRAGWLNGRDVADRFRLPRAEIEDLYHRAVRAFIAAGPLDFDVWRHRLHETLTP